MTEQEIRMIVRAEISNEREYSMTDHQLKFLVSDLLSRINKVKFELDDDPNYTKEDAIADLEETSKILEESYPRKGWKKYASPTQNAAYR